MKKSKQAVKFLVAMSIIGTTFSPMLVQAAVVDDTSKISNEVDLSTNSENVKASDLLTYDQLVNEVVKNENLSVDEAKKFLGINPNARARGDFYRTYSVDVSVTSYYKPKISFYCRTSEWDQYIGIQKVLNSSLNRSYKGHSKQFQGTLYTNLENAYTIYYELNGDFYENGTTSTTGGSSIQIGEGTKFTFTSSNTYASNHFRYANVKSKFSLY